MGHSGALEYCQLYIPRVQTTSQIEAHWGTVYCAYRGHRQPVRQGALGHCLMYIQKALATNRGRGAGGTEDTDNQINRRHT